MYDFTNDDLATYLRFLNSGDGGNLTEDLAHWRRFGITTANELGDYLDECIEKERRKGNIVE